MGLTEIFQDVLPILQKAAPLICNVINSRTGFIACSVMAAAFGTSADNYAELAKRLSNDPDLYEKLAALEATHGQWLHNMHVNGQ
jgi:hypothetical protein